MFLTNKIPLILDGSLISNINQSMPAGAFLPLWVLENQQEFIELQKSYKAAGSSIIITPTYGANQKKLTKYGITESVQSFNKRLVDLSRSAVGADTVLAGAVSPTGEFRGITDDFNFSAAFESAYELYKSQILALKSAGVDLIFAQSIKNISDARAALIASKELCMQMFITFKITEDSEVDDDDALLSALVTLEAMGVEAFGVESSGGLEATSRYLKKIAPYSEIPLIAKPNVNDSNKDEKGFEASLQKLIHSGARLIGGGNDTNPSYIKKVAKEIESETIPELPEPQEVIAAACENNVFFLAEDIMMSAPIEAGFNLADDLIDLEDERVNVARVHVSHDSDPCNLAAYAHISRLPVAILADNVELLEKSLRLFPGRALIESSAEIPPGEILPIAQKYGGIII